MDNKRTVPLGIILSAVTSHLMWRDLGEVQEFCEWFLGRSIYTHEYAEQALWLKMKSIILEQHPDLDIEPLRVSPENFEEVLTDLGRRYGDSREIESRPESRTESPFESLERVMSRAVESAPPAPTPPPEARALTVQETYGLDSDEIQGRSVTLWMRENEQERWKAFGCLLTGRVILGMVEVVMQSPACSWKQSCWIEANPEVYLWEGL